MRIFLLFLILVFGGMCLAQTSPTSLKKLGNAGSKTWGVVVGISDYQDEDIPDLRFAHKDAEAFALWLESPAGGGLDEDHLQVLLNDQATAGRVAEALDALLERVQENDKVFIYFSGHGDVERKTLSQPGFLLCWDAPSRVYMGGGTYSLAYLQEVVATLSLKNKAKVTVIADACRAGKLAGSQVGGPQLTSANLQRQQANELKILSCQAEEYSLEGTQWGGGRGVFSYHLMDGLYGLADRNKDGVVTLGELDRYLEDHVTAQAAPISQVPVLLGNKTENIAIIHEETLADLNRLKSGDMVYLAATESRGLEDEVLAELDSGIVKQYLSFKEAVKEKRFFPSAGNKMDRASADELYSKLIAEPGLSPLYGAMTRNYAAALQDDAQQVLNTMLRSGLTSEILSAAKAADIYRNYPAYLDRAAELLGSGHYMYEALKARKHYFEGTLQTTRSEKKQQFFQALHWQEDMPHAYAALINRYPTAQADSAEYYAARAMQIAPAWVKPYINLSHFYKNASQPDKAEELLNRASLVDSSSILVWYEKANFYKAQKKHDAAEHWYLKAISGSGADICFPCAYNNLGNIYEDMGRFAEAEEQYKKAIRLDSTNAGAYNNLGEVYRNTRRYAEAEQQYRKAIRLDSTLALAYNNLGLVYNNTRRYAEAEQQFKKAIRLDSTDAIAYNNLGNVYLNTRRYAEAEEQYKKAIQLDSTNVTAYYNLACMQSLQNQTEAAFGYLEKALKNGFNYYTLMQQDSDLAPLREQKDRWEALMQNAIVKDTTDAKAWNNLGQVYIRARNYAPAEAAMLKAVALDASSAPYMSNLGYIYLNLARYPEAEAGLTKAIALDSAFANARKHLGMVCFKTKRPDEARQHFQKALELNPDYAGAMLGMAYLLAAEGKTAEAIDYVEQAIGKGVTMEQLESDEDLAPLRALPEWEALRRSISRNQ